MQLLPADACDMSQILDELVTHSLIMRYMNNGARVIVIPGFIKHQRPHPKEAASTLPAAKKNGRAVELHGKKLKGDDEQAGNGDGDGDGDGYKDTMPGGAPDPVPFLEIVDHLNAKTGSAYRHTSKATRAHIRARWADGASIEDFRAVIDAKAAEWSRDPKWSKFLRPETLFGPKFDGYREDARRNGKRARKLDEDLPDLDAIAEAERRTT